MSTVRVWLSAWEWACCGEPFSAGDVVSFACREPRGTWLVERFGEAFAESITLVEEHHDDGGDDRPVQTIEGTVRGIHAVVVDQQVVRVALPPRPAPAPAPMELGNGVTASRVHTRPFTLTSEPIAGTVRLRPASRVPDRRERDTDTQPASTGVDLEDGAVVVGRPGWVVDVEIR